MDLLIACVYFSPIHSSYIHSTNARTDYFNILVEQITKFASDRDIFICGDLNSRTAQLDDFQEAIPGTDGELSYLANYDTSLQNEHNVGKRFTRDTVVNEYGRNLIEFYKCSGYRILNWSIFDHWEWPTKWAEDIFISCVQKCLNKCHR